MVRLLRSHATKQQLEEMAEELGVYIKLAVDIRKGILAGGGALHVIVKHFYSMTGAGRKTFGERIGSHLHSKYVMKH